MKIFALILLFSVTASVAVTNTIEDRFKAIGQELPPIQTKQTCVVHTLSQMITFYTEVIEPVTPWEERYKAATSDEKLLNMSGAGVESFMPSVWEKYPLMLELPPDIMPFWGRSKKDFAKNLFLRSRLLRATDTGNLAWARLQVMAGKPVAMAFHQDSWEGPDGHALMMTGYDPETDVYTFRNWWEGSQIFTLTGEDVVGHMAALYSLRWGTKEEIPTQLMLLKAAKERISFITPSS